ncbi:insulin growth factor-like family member 1 [Ctenodactylus gundi]
MPPKPTSPLLSTAVPTALCLLTLICSHGAPVSPMGATLMLCQPYSRCGDKFYDPLHHCCHDGALMALGQARLCGNCSYRVCFEQCCPRWPPDLQEPLVVRLSSELCSSPPSPGDRLCRRIISMMNLERDFEALHDIDS